MKNARNIIIEVYYSFIYVPRISAGTVALKIGSTPLSIFSFTSGITKSALPTRLPIKHC